MKKPNENTLFLFANELDAIKKEATDKVGEKDAKYIRKIVKIQRSLEIAGRGSLFFSLNPIFWVTGTICLSISKILENMEIGHNVMHGQYDWMNDQALNSKTYEWDNACESQSWARTHNFIHHTYNNILGKDKDIGYGVMRITEKQEWKPRHVFQMLHSFILASFFEWGVGLHEMQADEIRDGKVKLKDKLPILKSFLKKASRQFFKDYVFFPLLTGPAFIPVLFANMTANLARNLWSSAVIFCGHFPDGTHVFTEDECRNESPGHWYYRQILGSANFSGGKLIHLMSGHLSFQIEHHLFPDVPAHRYQEMAPKVKKVCEKYGISYNNGPFLKQYVTVLKKIYLHSSPQMKKS